MGTREMREIISILMESSLYFQLPVKERLEIVRQMAMYYEPLPVSDRYTNEA